MLLADLEDEMVYSVIKYLPERQVVFATGVQLKTKWEQSENVQKFSATCTNQHPSGYVVVSCTIAKYILVRASPELVVQRQETLRIFGKVIDADPIIVCLLGQ